MAFKFNYAIVREIPKSFETVFPNVCSRTLADEQQALIDALQTIGIDVLVMHADENSPQCPLVDELAVVINNSALICNPPGGRESEVREIRKILKHNLKLLNVQELKCDGAKLRGNDVLFTGKEIIIGLSSWTNEQGARSVAVAFPEYPVVTIKLDNSSHASLKDHVTMAGPGVLGISGSEAAIKAGRNINSVSSFTYRKLSLVNPSSLHLIYANGHLVHMSEAYLQRSYHILVNKIEYNRRELHLPELAKCQLSISNFCLLVGQVDVRDLRSLPSTLI